MLIECEGVDGSGKSTNSAALAERLNGVLFRFPDRSTPSGKLIQQVFDNGLHACVRSEWNQKWVEAPHAHGMMLQSLMHTNRLEKANHIRANLLAHKTVVCDRYLESAPAYGGVDGLDRQWLLDVNKALPQPDLSLLFDIDVGTFLERRAQADRDSYYEKDQEKLEKVINAYRTRWLEERGHDATRWVIINARGTKESTFKQILDAVEVWRRLHAAE